MTEEQFKEKLYEFDNHVQLISHYINSKTKITVKCNRCGNIWVSMPYQVIRKRRPCSCPKCGAKIGNKNRRKTTSQFKQQMLKIHPQLQVIGEYKTKQEKIKMHCKKHNVDFDGTPNELLKGRTSCPYCIKQKNHLTHHLKSKQNFLKEMSVINPDVQIILDYYNAKTYINCRCKKCNYEWISLPCNLLSGCGCPSCSKYTTPLQERKVRMYLLTHDIDFKMHKSFDDLKGISGGKLSYDFYIPKNNLLIEVQGRQHQKPLQHFGGIQTFQRQIKNDNIKREYADKNGYSLKYLWYYDINRVDEILDDMFNGK